MTIVYEIEGHAKGRWTRIVRQQQEVEGASCNGKMMRALKETRNLNLLTPCTSWHLIDKIFSVSHTSHKKFPKIMAFELTQISSLLCGRILRNSHKIQHFQTNVEIFLIILAQTIVSSVHHQRLTMRSVRRRLAVQLDAIEKERWEYDDRQESSR